jgi:hypothetical protein
MNARGAGLLLMLVALPLVPLSSGVATAAELSPQLRQLIIGAGLSPWERRSVSLDERLNGPSGEAVSLRQFVTAEKPTIAYMFGYG